MTIRIEPIADSTAADEALEALLHESYVGGGFAARETAATSFRAAAVRARGMVLVARDEADAVLGTVTLVTPDSQARRLATTEEREIHLLCVRPDMRGSGVGEALMKEALRRARASGALGVVLWTQPTMHAAQRLYERLGFRRHPGDDFTAGARGFLVYRLAFAPGAVADTNHKPTPRSGRTSSPFRQLLLRWWDCGSAVRPLRRLYFPPSGTPSASAEVTCWTACD